MALKFQFPGILSVHCLFGDAGDGNISLAGDNSLADAAANRRRFFDLAAKSGLGAWSELKQVHGDKIIVDPEATVIDARPDSLPQADGLTTNRPGLGLMIKTADCQPILLTDSQGRRIMAIHAGWRGNRADFPGRAVKRFCEIYDLEPGDILAARGPSLGPNAAEFVNFDSEWGPQFSSWLKNGAMDLWALTRFQLEQAGVPGRQIYEIDICTYDNSESWFSWRRSRSGRRQAALIWIKQSGERR